MRMAGNDEAAQRGLDARLSADLTEYLFDEQVEILRSPFPLEVRVCARYPVKHWHSDSDFAVRAVDLRVESEFFAGISRIWNKRLRAWTRIPMKKYEQIN